MTVIEKKYRALELLMKVEEEAVIEKITQIILQDLVLKVDDEEITDKLKLELDKRKENYLSGKSKSFSWSELKEKARTN